MTRTIGLITPGGDAPGMNACIRAVVRSGISNGYRILGIKRGYSGLLENDIIELSSHSVSNIVQRGGTILKSARCKKIKEPVSIREAGAILKENRIDWLVIIGGDGSFRAGMKISAASGIPVTGIPATIDNDVYGTEETIGFDTAIDTAIEAIDKIRDTATSFDRIFVIEVMGREHGLLALNIAAASGAEFTILPEVRVNVDSICREFMEAKSHHKSSAIIIFAEGAGDPRIFAEKLQAKCGMEVRVSSLGYIQRGGSPSARSRILGARFGVHAIKLINSGKRNRLVAIKGGNINDIPLRSSVGKKIVIDMSLYKVIRQLAI